MANNNYNVKAYFVKGCKISYKRIFSGYILNLNDEPIIDSIKRKVGMESLLCEITNEGFDYESVDMYSIPVAELSLGDIMVITGNYCKY